MIITCPSCKTRYKVEPAQFGPMGRRVRCTGCAHVWTESPAADLPKVIDPAPATDHGRDGGATPRARERDEEPDQDRHRNPAGWAILALVIVAIIIGGTLGRDAIITAWPAAERLYLALGSTPHPRGDGLTIKVLSHDRSIAGGRKFIVIKGEITNTSDEARDIPKLKVSLRAADARALASWDFAAARPRLLPGQSSAFVTRYQDPPDGATGFEIDFLQ
jgi:predicted Zn finger-like uncharacterized protein